MSYVLTFTSELSVSAMDISLRVLLECNVTLRLSFKNFALAYTVAGALHGQ